MVAADNVNYDVLTLIFAFLGNADLAQASLVSKSFNAGATPTLYKSICFRINHMKKWPEVASPFSAIVAHPELGVHIRSLDIKAVPMLKGQPHPSFIAAGVKCLSYCPNLSSFTCAERAAPFLALLPRKERLTELKVHAALNTEQVNLLTRIRGLQTLALYQSSWNVCHALSRWIPTLAGTLSSFAIVNSYQFNEEVLKLLLTPLCSLRSLHIVGCPKLSHHDILGLLSYTPVLESLSLTTWEHPVSAPGPPIISLPHLRHLSLDTRCTYSPHSVPSLYTSIFTALRASPLSSITIKLSARMVVGDTFITQILNDHSATLTRLNAINVSLTESSMYDICMRCPYLEQLAVVIPVKELDAFADSLMCADSLRTLIDVGDSHSQHGPHLPLTAGDVRQLFHCAPELQKVISGNRCWTGKRIPIYASDYDSDEEGPLDGRPHDYEVELKLERLRRPGHVAHVLQEDNSCS